MGNQLYNRKTPHPPPHFHTTPHNQSAISLWHAYVFISASLLPSSSAHIYLVLQPADSNPCITSGTNNHLVVPPPSCSSAHANLPPPGPRPSSRHPLALATPRRPTGISRFGVARPAHAHAARQLSCARQSSSAATTMTCGGSAWRGANAGESSGSATSWP